MSRPDSTPDAARALARLPLFEGLDARTLEETAAVTTWRDLKKRQQVLSKGAAGDHLLFLASGRLRGASVYQTILCLPNASQRVYALILRLCKVAPGGLVVVEYPPKQQALAIMANTSRESVSRAMKVLTDRRIVEKDHHRLIVR